VEALDERGVFARMVIGSTKPQARALAYKECEEGRTVIVAVAVLSEGVDMPWLGRLIDARPTVSPVEFVQRIGRIMRPGKGYQPEYICCCRNLERHLYLFGGAVPREAVKAAQEAFEQPTKRDGHRSLGFEALARFKRIPYPLDGGLTGSMFNVHEVTAEGVKVEWCVLTTPLSDSAIVARRDTRIERDEKGEIVKYHNGKWARATMPDDFAGFATSQQRGALSEKQAEWWERSARRYGLDPEAAEDIKRRQFQALPVLADLKVNLLDV
jgi:superfamily II DNA or RNA helicase